MTIHQWDNTLGRPIMKYFLIMNYQPFLIVPHAHILPHSCFPIMVSFQTLHLTRIFPFQALSLSLYYLRHYNLCKAFSYQLIASPYHAWLSHYLTCLLHILHGTENYIWNYVIHFLVSFVLLKENLNLSRIWILACILTITKDTACHRADI